MRRATRLSLGIGVTGVATAWFVSRAHWAEVGAALGGLRLGWVAAAAAVLYLEFVLRALRWRSLLWELAPGATFAPLFRATVIGMGLNVALPFRAGDVARPVLGARACRAPVLPFLALAGVERVLDLLGLGAVFVTMVATLPASLRGRGLMVDELERYGTLAVAAALVAFAALVAVAMQRERAAALLVRLAGVLPARVRGRVTPAIDGVVAGLGAVGSGRALAEAGALTLVHWAMGVLSLGLLFVAFGIDVAPAAACFTAVAIAIGAALPQAPGYVGVFHSVVENSLLPWGVDLPRAQAFALVAWAVSFAPVTLTAVLAAWWEGLRPSTVGELTSVR